MSNIDYDSSIKQGRVHTRRAAKSLSYNSGYRIQHRYKRRKYVVMVITGTRSVVIEYYICGLPRGYYHNRVVAY